MEDGDYPSERSRVDLTAVFTHVLRTAGLIRGIAAPLPGIGGIYLRTAAVIAKSVVVVVLVLHTGYRLGSLSSANGTNKGFFAGG